MIMQEINISIDTGKGFTKWMTKHPETNELLQSKFPTHVQKVMNMGIEVSRNSFLIRWKDENWLAGDMLSGSSINTNLTKKTNEHLLSINLAICEAIRMTRKNVGIFAVNLCCNVPLTIIKNQELKKEYEDFIRQDNDTVYMTVNNEHFLFVIKRVFLLQEGLGSLFVRHTDFRDKRSTQIDVGTLNCTVSSFSQLVPQLDSNFSNNLGTNSLYSHLREKLSTRFGITVDSRDMEQIIKDRVLVIEGKRVEESTKIIQDAMMTHAKDIVSSIKSHVSLNNTAISLVGGGSLLLHDQLQALLPNAVFESDPQFCSLKSFHTIMEAKLHASQL